MPALMQERVVLDVVLIEVVRECVIAVPVISSLEEDACCNQPGDPTVPIVKWMDGGEKEVSRQGVDCGRETTEIVSVDESNVSIHQSRDSLWRRSRVNAADLSPPYLNSRGSPDASARGVDAGFLGNQLVHVENIRK